MSPCVAWQWHRGTGLWLTAAGRVILLLSLAACAAPQPAPAPATAISIPQPTATLVLATLPAAVAPDPAATATPSPAPTSTPTASPAPAPRRLTTGGCCVQPFWSPDGLQVRYIDRPSAISPAGIWGVPIEGGAPQFVTGRLGIYSPDGSLVAYPEGGQTYVERSDGSQRWTVPSGGRAVAISPDNAWIAWQAASSSVDFDRRRVDVWVARVDGEEARQVASLTGGGVSGWFPDSVRLLVSGWQPDDAQPVQYLAALKIADGSMQPLVLTIGLRGGSLSPEGGWLAYTVAFSGDPGADGLWVAGTSGAPPLRLSTFGAYRWRSEGRLVLIPLEAGPQRLLAVDAATGDQHALTEPTITPLHIAEGDWSLAPDGRRVAYVSADDHNIWLLELNP